LLREVSARSLDGEGFQEASEVWIFAETSKDQKKEEFPGFMENMLPGNSFPQICVVSVHIMPIINIS